MLEFSLCGRLENVSDDNKKLLTAVKLLLYTKHQRVVSQRTFVFRLSLLKPVIQVLHSYTYVLKVLFFINYIKDPNTIGYEA